MIVVNTSSFFRSLFQFLTFRYDQETKTGIRVVLRNILDNRTKMAILVGTQWFAALFEIGSISILGLAVGVLSGEVDVGQIIGVGRISDVLSDWFVSFGQRNVFIVLIFVAVLLQLIKSGIAYLGTVLRVEVSKSVNVQVTATIVEHNMTLTYHEASKDAPGYVYTLIDTARDLVNNLLNGMFGAILTSVVMLIVFLAAMLLISIELTVVAIVLMLILNFSLNGVTRKLKGVINKTNRYVLELGESVVEYLGAERLLRVTDQTGWAIGKVQNIYLKYYTLQKKIGILQAPIDPLIQVFSIAGIGLFLIGGYIILGEASTLLLPKMLMFMLIIHRSLQHGRNLITFRITLAGIETVSERLGSYLLRETVSPAPAQRLHYGGLQKEIVFDNVSFRYPETEKDVLTNVCLTISKGETVAIVGPSGEGKSTLIDIFLGLYNPSNGRVLVDGKDLKQIGRSDWLRHNGVVDQDVLLLNTSVSENIRFGREQFDQADIEHVARTANAHEFIVELEQGYKTVIGNRGYRLSGGQQQRLAIARALLSNPDILILDEATSALDTEAEQHIQKTLEGMRRERTILMIAHRLSTVYAADKIAVLEKGQITEFGSAQELIDKKGKFASLWALQNKPA